MIHTYEKLRLGHRIVEPKTGKREAYQNTKGESVGRRTAMVRVVFDDEKFADCPSKASCAARILETNTDAVEDPDARELVATCAEVAWQITHKGQVVNRDNAAGGVPIWG
jgi:hypothetical protein